MAPCNWATQYVQDLARLETEFMVRPYLTARARQSYTGVTGKVAGVGRPPASGKDRFLLAFHRAVAKPYQPGENYGPEEDARTASTDQLRWSANYGATFRRTPTSLTAAGEPEKHEIVLVSVEVYPSGGGLAVDATPWVHPTRGAHMDGHPDPGASARDPVLAANDAGDIVMVYQLTQDPFFRFDLDIQPSTQTTATVRSTTSGGDPGECTQGGATQAFGDFTVNDFPRSHWQNFVANSRWNRFYTETVVEAWMEGTPGFGGPPASHGWNPSIAPQVVVGERRQDGKASIFVSWKQIPYDRRKDFRRMSVRQEPWWPVYAVYGMRLVAETNAGLSNVRPAPHY